MLMHAGSLLPIYVVPILLVLGLYLHKKKAHEDKSLSIQKQQIDAGLTEPPSLHPVFDHSKCLGCGSCVRACPEKNVLGLIRGKAELICPTHCVGHGVCKEACPAGGITLVFGTKNRGIDIPTVKPDFETNVPGIYIAGELGGKGLIRNAFDQGRQALESIKQKVAKDRGTSGVYDVIIVGVGPAGFSATLAAKGYGLNYLTLEQETLGGTVAHYPKGKVVMTSPTVLPMVGKVRFKETTKEEILCFLKDAEQRSEININYDERVVRISRDGSVLTVITHKGTYRSQTVLLAIGRRGIPRKLGVPGEDKPKVVYEMIDPGQFEGQHVLVVGGGNSALEAATTLAAMPGTTVTLSYRGDAFSRAAPKNRELIESAQEEGRLDVIMNSNVQEILDNEVILDQNGGKFTIKNDSVIVCAGGILPTGFLKEIGIESETKYGVA